MLGIAEISWPWVDNGQPFELGGLPIAGKKEILNLQSEQADRIAELATATAHLGGIYMAATRRLLERAGPEKAKQQWDAEVRPHLPEGQLDWPDEDWEQEFIAWSDREMGSRYGTTDPEAVIKTAEGALKGIDVEKAKNARRDYETEALVAQVFWRLWGRFDKITVPGDGEVPLTRENLELVLSWPEDERKIREALKSDVKAAVR